MASLDEFNSTSGATLDQFQIEAPLVPVNNPASNKNLAAYTAALSEDPESVEATYLQSLSELDAGGEAVVAKQVQEKAKEFSYSAHRKSLANLMVDPSVSDEQKRVAAEQFLDKTNEHFNVRNTLSVEALVADSEDETPEAEEARVSFAESVDEVNQYKRQMQARLNAEMNKSNPTMLETAADIVEIMVPFGEASSVGGVVSDLRNGDASAYAKAMTMLGETKEDLVEKLQKLPPSERAVLAERVVDAINNNSSIVLPDDNDFARVDFLRTALEDGYYGEGFEYLDNIVSILDMTMLGGIVARGARAASRAIRGGRAVESAEEGAEIRRIGQEEYEEAWEAHTRANGLSPDDELRAAEDAAETRTAQRRDEFNNDPVRREEDAAERRAEARRAVQSNDDSLRNLEDQAEQRATTRRTGGNAVKSDSELRALEDEAATKAAVRSRVQPVSLSQNYKDTNPAKARAANQAAGDAPTDEVAEAMYGSNKTEAIANDELAEIARTDGAVKNKVSIPDRAPKSAAPPVPRIMDLADQNGAIYLTRQEKASAATRVVHDFNNATGLTTRKEMVTPHTDDIGGGFTVDVMYGPKDMGWGNGKEAIDLVKWSLRDYGVAERDITLMRKAGDEYVPVSKDSASEAGDYLVKVNYPYQISTKEIEDWSDMDVLRNFFDRVPHFKGASNGSFNRHILDAHSMLHPNITFGANVSVDRASALERVLLQQTEEFSKPYGKLPKDQQQVVEQIIKKSNFEGKFPSKTQMIADGLNDQQISTLKAWKEVWDTMYWLENKDMVKTLRNRGFGVLEDESTNSRLFAKPVARNQAGSAGKAYDLESGQVKSLSSAEMKELYDSGGTLANLRAPMVVGDESIETVISRNRPGSSYIRGLRDDDTVLNYREGYYTVYYDAPKFVEKIVRDSRGNELYRRAVATAGDTKEAELVRNRLAAAEGLDAAADFNIRGDLKKMRSDSDTNWDLNLAGGRTAQRVRGERLEDASSPITAASHNHILGPVDSLITSVRSTATRVSMRDYLEATKARAMEQYADVFPKNKFGQTQFPADSSKIVSPGNEYSKRAADARTTVEYIHYLENGYINSLDEGIKAAFRGIADALGETGFAAGERAARAASEVRGPTAVGKNTAFTLYLATNPFRQLLVQGHQAVQLLAIAPKYATTRLVKDAAALIEMKTTGKSKLATATSGRSERELQEMLRHYEDSGLSAGIDKQNLVRGSLTQIAEDSRIAGRKNPVARSIAMVRKAGFDTGEEFNMLTAWLTHYNMAKEAKGGKALTQADLDKVAAQARNYTYNMNRAGDMPYNENALGLMFQFMQVPHKSLLQFTTNRGLTKTQKARIATFNTVFYGAPAGSFLYAMTKDWIPEDGELREVITQGLESYIFNKFLTLSYGEDVAIDFSGLAATDGKGLYEFITQMWTTNFGEIMANTPAGSLYFGSNPRITNFAKTAAEFFHFREPADMTPATLSETMIELGSLSSGFSNAWKARQALEYAKRYNSFGGVVDSRVNSPEAIARIFGFGTLDEAQRYHVSGRIYEESKSFEDDVKNAYKEFKRAITKEGITNEEQEYAIRTYNWAWKAFEDSPRARQIILQQLRYDVQNQDDALFRSAIRAGGWMENEEVRDLINTMPGTDEQRQKGRETIDFIQNYQGE